MKTKNEGPFHFVGVHVGAKNRSGIIQERHTVESESKNRDVKPDYDHRDSTWITSPAARESADILFAKAALPGFVWLISLIDLVGATLPAGMCPMEEWSWMRKLSMRSCLD